MINSGYRVEFQNMKEKIYDVFGELIGSGEQTRGNFFNLDLSNKTCLFAQFEDVWLWHRRLCHVNFDNIVEISNKNRVRGLQKKSKPNKVM